MKNLDRMFEFFLNPLKYEVVKRFINLLILLYLY